MIMMKMVMVMAMPHHELYIYMFNVVVKASTKRRADRLYLTTDCADGCEHKI